MTIAAIILAPLVTVTFFLDWAGTRPAVSIPLLFAPQVIGIIGAVSALFYRRLPWGARIAWGLASLVVGFSCVPAAWWLGTLLLGP